MTAIPKVTSKGRARAQLTRDFGAGWLTHRKDRFSGTPFILEPWQWKDIILPIYGTLDSRGHRWYNRVLIIIPRWNGKTEVGSLLVNDHLFLSPVDDGEAYAVATSLKQANIAFSTVKGMIQPNPELRSMVDISKKEILVKSSQCVFRSLPHDADLAQGFHPSFALIDELHVHRNRNMLDAMWSGMIGREDPLLVCITTVGPAQDGVWWEVYQDWLEDPKALVVFYGAKPGDDPHDPKVWRKANPASWITPEMLQRAYEGMPFSSFCRYHLNLPGSRSSDEKAFDITRWRACDARPEIDSTKPCIVSVDASLRRDDTAVVLNQRDSSGVHHARVWFFEGEGDGDERGYVDREKVAEHIRFLCSQYKVERIVCDPAYFREQMEELEREGFPIEEYPQKPVYMSPASQSLFDVIAQGRLHHGGDAHLTEHVLNAVVTETGYGWRIDKPDKRTKIDGCIALAIAVHMAEVGLPKPQVWAGSW